jgi:hypothetical protein
MASSFCSAFGSVAADLATKKKVRHTNKIKGVTNARLACRLDFMLLKTFIFKALRYD